MKFIVEGKSDPGVIRKTNEDTFSFIQNDNYLAALVCDGMGGYKGGAAASEISSQTITEHFKSLPSNFDIEKEVIASFRLANDAITRKAEEKKEYSQMGTTVALLLIKDSEFTTAHLGDSRVYLIRDGHISCLTKDHSRVQQIMDEENISLSEALKLADRNVITRALGINGLSRPEIRDKSKVIFNDIFVLCSDGLTNFVNDYELLDLATEFTPEIACEQLIYLANLRGGEDNITVLIVKVIE